MQRKMYFTSPLWERKAHTRTRPAKEFPVTTCPTEIILKSWYRVANESELKANETKCPYRLIERSTNFSLVVNYRQLRRVRLTFLKDEIYSTTFLLQMFSATTHVSARLTVAIYPQVLLPSRQITEFKDTYDLRPCASLHST